MDKMTYQLLREGFAAEIKVLDAKRAPSYFEEHKQIADAVTSYAAQFGAEAHASVIRALAKAVSGVRDWLVDKQFEGKLSLPMMSAKRVQDMLSRLKKVSGHDSDSLAALTAAYIFETRQAQELAHTRSLSVEIELGSYIFWSQISAELADVPARLQTAEAEYKKEIGRFAAEAKLRTEHMSGMLVEWQKASAEAQSLAAAAKSTVDEAEQKVKTTFFEVEEKSASLQEVLSQSDAKLTALKEGLATISAQKLWDNQASYASRAFWFSAAVLVTLLLVLPTLALVFLDDVLSLLRHIGEATMQGLPAQPTDTQLAITAISRLVVITLPIVLYLWVVKLVVRFNSRSLILLDDAKQRHTMMDTYFHLVGEKMAETEDRAVMLAALFRPAPGHGPDNVEPPNFVDLMEKAMKK